MKTIAMNKVIISLLFLFAPYAVSAQETRTDILRDLEKNRAEVSFSNQDQEITATLKSASRLFGEKDDLTTVIMVIPSGSVVEIIDSDSTYYQVLFEDYEGYIFRRHAVINEQAPAPVRTEKAVAQQPVAVEQVRVQPAGQNQAGRYTYLENKYGRNIASRLIAGKIWKGMSAEMINDSWGSPRKINRIISGNTVKEEWIFTNTWLYVENDVLRDWGPVK